MKRKASGAMEELRKRVEAWRVDHGGRGSRIPEELWNDAVSVAGNDGVCATAQALRFNADRLRRRFEATQDDEGKKQVPALTGTIARKVAASDRSRGRERAERGAAQFVALEMGALGSASAMVIDLVSCRGDRMRVEAPTGNVDVVGLIGQFWSRSP